MYNLTGGEFLLRSMTGYGRGEASGAGRKFTVELKSVNHRFCEVVIRQPRVLSPLEDRMRKYIQNRVVRGRIDAYLSIEECGQKEPLVKVDKGLAVAYYKAMDELRDALAIQENVSLKDLVSFPNVLAVEEPEENVEEWWPVIEAALTMAADQLVTMRETEGGRLQQDLLERVGFIEKLAGQIEQQAPQVVVDYRERLQQRLAEWLADGTIDQSRLAAEAAIFADRASITEETVRLASHLGQARTLLASDLPVGRKFDFLVQEMNREINTIGSKANDLAITNGVLEAKSELEKIREQIQNIE